VLNRWDAFVRYTSDGRISIDNNVIERLLRPIAIGRNYLFFGSEHGGQTAATLYTLVQSARRNCVDVWPYLTDVLRRIAAIAPGDTAALEALLPDRWLAEHAEHRLEQREEEFREAQACRRRKRAARRLPSANSIHAPVPKSICASSPAAHSMRRNGRGLVFCNLATKRRTLWYSWSKPSRSKS
jgi:hypothetical protein